jgi:LemA protein
MTFLVILAILAAVGLYVAWAYNGLIDRRNKVKNAFAQIDVQLTRRHDLIPNLVEAVKGYMQHERSTLEAVTAARNQAAAGLQAAAARPGDPAAMRQLASAEAALEGALGRLLAVVEAYPDLKADENMLRLQEELSSTENKVSFARQGYNDAVMDYNTACESFPTNLVAGAFRFEEAEFLDIESEAKREVPAVSF